MIEKYIRVENEDSPAKKSNSKMKNPKSFLSDNCADNKDNIASKNKTIIIHREAAILYLVRIIILRLINLKNKYRIISEMKNINKEILKTIPITIPVSILLVFGANK